MSIGIVSVTTALVLGREIESLVTFLGLLLVQSGILYRVEKVRGDTKEILNGGMEAKIRKVLDDRDREWQAAGPDEDEPGRRELPR
jgi:hypothetical protein